MSFPTVIHSCGASEESAVSPYRHDVSKVFSNLESRLLLCLCLPSTANFQLSIPTPAAAPPADQSASTFAPECSTPAAPPPPAATAHPPATVGRSSRTAARPQTCGPATPEPVPVPPHPNSPAPCPRLSVPFLRATRAPAPARGWLRPPSGLRFPCAAAPRHSQSRPPAQSPPAPTRTSRSRSASRSKNAWPPGFVPNNCSASAPRKYSVSDPETRYPSESPVSDVDAHFADGPISLRCCVVALRDRSWHCACRRRSACSQCSADD